MIDSCAARPAPRGAVLRRLRPPASPGARRAARPATTRGVALGAGRGPHHRPFGRRECGRAGGHGRFLAALTGAVESSIARSGQLGNTGLGKHRRLRFSRHRLVHRELLRDRRRRGSARSTRRRRRESGVGIARASGRGIGSTGRGRPSPRGSTAPCRCRPRWAPRTAPTEPATARACRLVVRGRLKMLLERVVACGPVRDDEAGIGLAGRGAGRGREGASIRASTGGGGGAALRARPVQRRECARRAADRDPAPAFAIDPGATPRLLQALFSARIVSSVVWLSGVSLSNRTPIPGVTFARAGSCSRIQTTVPSPASSGAASCSWNSSLRRVPTASGSRVRMKIPPRLTSTRVALDELVEAGAAKLDAEVGWSARVFRGGLGSWSRGSAPTRL